ncbi:MAG: hypothetical protein DMF91_25195 [Acidobacteria bacterium]|nr:MAG: hypothetical protein DMF91_25195 [Acidobacteriota bacterium]
MANLVRSPASVSGEAFVEVREAIRRSIERCDPLIVVTGASGTGKTALCQSVLEEARGVASSTILNPFLTFRDLLKQVADDLDPASRKAAEADVDLATEHDLMRLIQRFVESNPPQPRGARAAAGASQPFTRRPRAHDPAGRSAGARRNAPATAVSERRATRRATIPSRIADETRAAGVTSCPSATSRDRAATRGGRSAAGCGLDRRRGLAALIPAGHSDPSRAPGVRAVVGTLSAGCQRKSADR